MSLGHGSKIVTDGLVLSIDPARVDPNNLTGTAYTGKSITTSGFFGKNISFTDGMYVGGKEYYTLYGLTYPEGNYGGRQGITPGISNTSAGKLYDASRDLNYYVYDDKIGWLPDSWFNGERTGGHCYDTYDGQPVQHATFQADFDAINANYPNATHIVIGSHAAENNDNDANTFARLQSIGVPDSHLGTARPEYIVVGKVNKPHTWEYVRENVSSASATMNLGLPLNVPNASWRFTSQSHSVSVSPALNLPLQKTLSFWIKSDRPLSDTDNWEIGFVNSGSTAGSMFGMMYGVGPTQDLGFWGYGSAYDLSVGSLTNKWSSDGNWHHCVITMDGTRAVRGYIDGEQITWYRNSDGALSQSYTMPTTTSNNFVINSRGAWNSGMSYVDLANVLVYDKALSTQEVKQNFHATVNRFIGETPYAPAKSGRHLKQVRPELPSGKYWIQHASINNGNPLQVYCDMETDGGGWTLLVQNASINGATKMNHTNWSSTNATSPPDASSRATVDKSYSIMQWANYLKNENDTFEYMLDAVDRGRWGGIWSANDPSYSFLQTSNSATNITLKTQFDSWSYNNDGIEARMPWVAASATSDGKLTTSVASNSSWWGTIIEAGSSFSPAPWMATGVSGTSSTQSPGVIWYWVR